MWVSSHDSVNLPYYMPWSMGVLRVMVTSVELRVTKFIKRTKKCQENHHQKQNKNKLKSCEKWIAGSMVLW